MTVRWTVRAATDRGPQAESRVLFEAPKKIANAIVYHHLRDINFCNDDIQDYVLMICNFYEIDDMQILRI